MEIITLSEAKEYLGITNDTDDNKINGLLEMIHTDIESVLGDLSQKEHEFSIKKRKGYPLKICSPKINTTKLISISGIDFSKKIEGVDYIIDDYNEIIVNYNNLVPCDCFGRIRVKVEAGFLEAPKTLKKCVLEQLQSLFYLDNGKKVASVKLGPRSITYENGTTQKYGYGENDVKFKSSLQSFIPLCLRVYEI